MLSAERKRRACLRQLFLLLMKFHSESAQLPRVSNLLVFFSHYSAEMAAGSAAAERN